jgi:UDP-N-acetyl-D-galactosamine dehydrogenase
LPEGHPRQIAIIGLGYVGLPLAVEFGKRYPTVGFDIKSARVAELSGGADASGEVSPEEIAAANHLTFSSDIEDIRDSDVYVIAVPTPIDSHRQPDLKPLLAASELVGRVISPGDTVIYESTVYPGATEEDCIPVIERVSGLALNRDFFAGYSPERINPGDKARPITKIVKVTSGSTPEAAEFIDGLYRSIIPAGTHLASSIKVAEASKIIENTQRDVNIALVNELSIIFSHLGIDTSEVIEAAATKWNFIKLKPGLVGGHCIGVDPYYLMQKSMDAGHVPDIIRLAREINDGMARHAAMTLVKAMIRKDVPIRGARVLVLGLTFKENCADIRNTKVVDLIRALREFGMEVDAFDSWTDGAEVDHEFGLTPLAALPEDGGHDAVVLAVAHDDLTALGPARLRRLMRGGGVLFDMKSVFARADSDIRL